MFAIKNRESRLLQTDHSRFKMRVQRFILFVIAAVVVPIQACPYMKNSGSRAERSRLTLLAKNPHTTDDNKNHQPTSAAAAAAVSSNSSSSSSSSSLTGRRKLQKKNRSSVASATKPHGRKLIFDPIVGFFKLIIDFILGLFGLDRPDTVAEAIVAARQDVARLLDGDRAAEMLRLAFHDCTDGTCNGCLDLTNLDNTGLADPIRDLQPIVDKYATFLTRGDVWVLAAYEAVERQQGESNRAQNSIVLFDLAFVGRPSCADPSNPPADTLPSAHLNTAGLTRFFANTFAFDYRETAAIMGAHTLYVFCFYSSAVFQILTRTDHSFFLLFVDTQWPSRAGKQRLCGRRRLGRPRQCV
jgi:Peroxidase